MAPDANPHQATVADGTPDPETEAAGGGLVDWAYVLHQLRSSPLTIVGLSLITLVLFTMAAAPWIAPYDPNRIDLTSRLAPPSLKHWMGTDQIGRDLFSRIIWGSRVSVSIGFAIVGISMLIGTVTGAFSGLVGGRTDSIIMRFMDVLLSFPSFVMAMALAAALGPDLINAMLAIAVVRIPFYVRLARGQALSLRERPYVKAAVTFGATRMQIVRRHVVPNAMAPIIVQSTLDIGSAILTAAALSFIGLGAQPPTAEWGAMVSAGRDYLLDQWWYATFPGLAILLTAVGFNLLGDGLRDILDPKLRAR
ncbi:D,D-dipeptide ABC transporter permease [Frigidibacter sp. ROC022]|uniref:D,D-dipeptide ABC transporter permease n=1 Tax=Frigidibacter sp. ROC022 TaxID=2971796 RepID=UPI00215AEEEF|nr:D,D-dipeptide ABC transporter permease [Frigidibacter sp. ROC022]MCR8725412.1 D,D-dipeptide ABC transporter permease [Frigidibacter sp. ROC022]